MKFVILGLVFLVNTAWSQTQQEEIKETVVQVLSHKLYKSEHVVSDESFNANLDGYACPWPGIIDDFIFDYGAALKHGVSYMDRNGLRVVFKEAMEFCRGGFPTGVKVFGPEYIKGASFKLTFTVRREIVNVKDFNNKLHLYLKESVSTTLLGRELKSTAYVTLDSEIPKEEK